MWIPNLARSNRLPADPYIIYVPDTSRYVKFSNFGDPIPASGIEAVITTAFEQIRDHFSSADAPIDRSLIFAEGDDNVEMWLLFPRITWRQWEEVLKVVRDFYILWSPVVLMFEVIETGSRVSLAKGNVTQNMLGPSS